MGIGLAHSSSRERSSSVADQPPVGARMHVLPKGYTRSRSFGGYHTGKRKDYLNRCRELLPIAPPAPPEPPERYEPTLPTCPRCEIEMCCIEKQPRPSWKKVFEREVYSDPAIYFADVSQPIHGVSRLST